MLGWNRGTGLARAGMNLLQQLLDDSVKGPDRAGVVEGPREGFN